MNLENIPDAQNLVHDPNAPLMDPPVSPANPNHDEDPHTRLEEEVIPPLLVTKERVPALGQTFMAQDIMAIFRDALKEHIASMRQTHEQEVAA